MMLTMMFLSWMEDYKIVAHMVELYIFQVTHGRTRKNKSLNGEDVLNVALCTNICCLDFIITVCCCQNQKRSNFGNFKARQKGNFFLN